MATDDLADENEPEPPRSSNRSIWYLFGGLVLVWIAYLAILGPRGLTGDLAAPDLSDPGLGRADYAWPLETLDGAPIELSQYRGRPILLNIWATWCGPCVAEFPSLRNLADHPEIGDTVVLAVSSEEREILQRFVGSERSRIHILRSPGDPPRVFFNDVFPMTFLIARDGRIVAAHRGAAQWDDPSVVSFLKTLAADDPNIVSDRTAALTKP